MVEVGRIVQTVADGATPRVVRKTLTWRHTAQRSALQIDLAAVFNEVHDGLDGDAARCGRARARARASATHHRVAESNSVSRFSSESTCSGMASPAGGRRPAALLRNAKPRSILNRMVKSSQLDSAFAALADPIRRSVLGQLRNGESTVSELATGYAISLPAFLKHVRVLEDAGLVSTRKIGRVRHCRYSPRRLADVEHWLREHRQFWERQLDSLEGYFTDRQREGTP